jgi:hypothetical protein
MRDLIPELLFVRLRNLVVLAIDAAQIAIAEKNVPRAVCADERGFFAEVRRVRRDDGQASRIAGGYLIAQAIVQTISRADSAALKQRFESDDASLKLTRLVQPQV